VRPTVLVGTTGIGGMFDGNVIGAMAAASDRPVIMPLSNPTSKCEATPTDILRWSAGRALVATGSPFDAVEVDGHRVEIGQANNVFVFPGLGLGAIAAEASTITPRMFLLAARALSDAVSDERLASGALYPPVTALRRVSRSIAIEVAREAVASGVAGIDPATDIDMLVDSATWWPDYVPYVPARPVERRRDGET
jgi:malic enzyme